MRPRKAERLAYGDDSSQFVEIWDAPGRASGTAVFFHGGFWRESYDLGLMDGLCADAARRGWLAVNVEYRRGRGWPAMAADVCDAWAFVVDTAAQPVVTLGHSAGGHLALWAAAACKPKPSLVVSLAGVADLTTARRLDLGGGAVAELFGDAPSPPADPTQLVPLGVTVVLVAPQADLQVPREVSASFAAAARDAGDAVSLVEPPGDHFSVIDPTSRAWADTWEHVERHAAGS